eukprot:TRINITY_DN30040_c0_g1_i1.p1 TRINITY_DN30040_c0_g1~~TRINITY_DN30040_c0_g1_i1.p1  ORF type:complete len:211 (+),score=57.68 TRINITY_DN30040_c0_g1_i1:154-786(+)
MGCCRSSAKGSANASTEVPSSESKEGAEDEANQLDDEQALKDQQRKAKKMVKGFVKRMVRGRALDVVLKTGKHKSCACSMSRTLDSLKIKVGGHSKTMELADIQEIHAGDNLKRIETPLDELCVTLIMASQDAITFRFPDVEERDTFAACLLMFVQRAQGGDEDCLNDEEGGDGFFEGFDDGQGFENDEDQPLDSARGQNEDLSVPVSSL